MIGKLHVRVLGVFLAALLLSTGAFATGLHNYHTSLTRIDYNAENKIAEITIQLFTHDLVPVLAKFSGRAIDLERTPEIDKLIFDYLTGTFVLKDKTGKPQPLTWVGKELESQRMFVHVQIPMPDGLQSATLQNTIFFEKFPKQTNLVISRFEKKKCDLLFVPGDGFKELTFKASSTAKR